MSAPFCPPLPWQQAQWTQISVARQRGQLNHAWLLAGPEGVGKRAFVLAFAAALLCETRVADGTACGHCRSCRMLANGGHPDAHLLTQDGHLGLAASENLQHEDGLSFWLPKKDSARRDIAVDAARSLIEKLTTASHLGGARVVVVNPASEMSEATANAMLKTVEEPPANSFLLFVAEFSQGIKQTIRSRCQLLRFAAPPAEAALDWLRVGHPAATAALLTEAGGAPLRAARWLDNDEPARRQRWRGVLSQVASRKADPLQAAQEIGRDKREVVALCRYWQETLHEQLRSASSAWSARHEIFLQGLLESLRRLEDQNANPQLVVESLMLRWRLLAPPPASG